MNFAQNWNIFCIELYKHGSETLQREAPRLEDNMPDKAVKMQIENQKPSHVMFFLRRLGAFIIDWLLPALVLVVSEKIGWLAALIGRWGLDKQSWPDTISEIIFAATVVAYFGVFQAYFGRTLGKILFGLKLVADHASVCIRSIRRFLIYPGPLFLLMIKLHGYFLIALFTVCVIIILDILVAVFSRSSELSLHDWLAGTHVVSL
jgi:uncharacterized RDD family membrane protein YckC